jgi:outer membrane protein assembly factor BamA
MKLVATGVVLCCVSLAGLGAEASSPAQIVSIHVVGEQRYSEAQIIAASGLQSGQDFDPNVLQSAAQRLGGSGAFEDVEYRYRPEGSGAAVEFTVKEATKLHRYVLDNFVWLNRDEIEAYLRKQVPLFAETLPESGTLLDDVTTALQALLASNKIDAKVERTQYGGLGNANWSHIFRVGGPDLKIQNVQFAGAQGMDPAVLAKEAVPLVGRSFSGIECLAFGSSSFLPLYRERGYLRASIGQPVARVVSQVSGTNHYDLDVTFPVTEGVIYSWNSAQWSGNQAFTSTDLDGLMGLGRGDLANGKKIDAGWEQIVQAYGKKGYIEATVRPDPVYDDGNKVVSFRAAVSEGQQYRMGALTITGVPPGAGEFIRGKWRLKPSAIYDSSYLRDFVSKDLPSLLSTAQVRVSSIQMQTHPNRDQLTVDVVIGLK